MASSFHVLSCSHRFPDSTTRLSLPNLKSYGDGSVTLSWPGFKTVKRAKSLRLSATLDENNEDDWWSDYKMSRERIKIAAMVMHVGALFAQRQIFEEGYVGYSDGALVEVYLNGAQAPLRVVITDAALKLGAKKLSLLVHEAYRDAYIHVVKAMRNKIVGMIKGDLEDGNDDVLDEIF